MSSQVTSIARSTKAVDEYTPWATKTCHLTFVHIYADY